MENTNDSKIAEERRKRKKEYNAEWQRRNKEKVKIYHDRWMKRLRAGLLKHEDNTNERV